MPDMTEQERRDAELADLDKGGGRQAPRKARGKQSGDTVRGAVAKKDAAAQKAEEQEKQDQATWDRNAYRIIEGWAGQIDQALAPQVPRAGFMRMCAIALVNSPQAAKLAKCTKPSLYNAIMQCAHYGLLPGTSQAAVIPYGDTATFVPQYQGFIQLAFNTGQVAAVTAKLIYRRDEWGIEYGPTGRGFFHRPRMFDDEGADVIQGRLGADFKVPEGAPGADNPPILAYCYATFKDGTHTEVELCSLQKAVETRDRYSKGYKWAEESHYGKPPAKDSFWHTNPEDAWLKTVVRRGMKYIPQSAALVELLLADQAADSTIPQAQPWTPPPALGPVPAFEPGGPGAAWEGDVRHGDGSVIQGKAEEATAAISGQGGMTAEAEAGGA